MKNKLITIWICEDLDSPGESGFGLTKYDAERHVSGNRGYDDYNRSGFNECLKDGWCKKAYKYNVPKCIAAAHNLIYENN